MGIIELIQAEMMGFEGDYAVYAEDGAGKSIDINGDTPWETASCIKVPVLLELYRRISKGEITGKEKIEFNQENYTEGSGVLRSLTPGLELSLRDMATLMIIVSDNVATNILIDYLGMDNINENCRDLGLQSTELINKIYFEPGRKPVIGITTPREFVKMFKLIRGGVYGPQATLAMEEILKGQHYNQLLTRNIPISLRQKTGDVAAEPIVSVASKSGALYNCRNDGGIVFTPWGHYFVAVFTKDFQDPYFYNDHVANLWAPRINQVVFQWFSARSGSF